MEETLNKSGFIFIVLFTLELDIIYINEKQYGVDTQEITQCKKVVCGGIIIILYARCYPLLSTFIHFFKKWKRDCFAPLFKSGKKTI